MASLVPPGLRRRFVRSAPENLTRHVRLLLQGQSAPQRTVKRLRSALLLGRLERGLARRPGGVSYVAVELDGRAVRARVVDEFRIDHVWAQEAARVADALAAHGVPHVFVSVDPYRRRVVAVPQSHRGRAFDALQAELGSGATQLAAVDRRTASRSRPLGSWRPHLTGAVRVFDVLATAQGQVLGGPELGCDVQFWREVGPGRALNANGETLPGGTLLGERTFEPLPETVDPAGVLDLEVDGRTRPVAGDLAHPHLLQLVDPVDVVYTWVDGTDPAWRARRDAELRDAGPLHDLAANESRFLSHDELRYSLRSLEMYAPWVRHVYLVTDDQTPAWLDRDHPRLSVVSHAELFAGRGRLPTFNSHAIESQLHHIDGLAENYLYLNDDVFFGRPVDPSLFVLANGLSKIFFSSVKVASGPVRPSDLPITSAAKNNRDLLLEKFGRTTLHKFQHAPYSLIRSVMEELEDVFGDELEQTASAPFRSPSDVSVSASLGLSYAYLVGKAVPGRLRYLYADIAQNDTPDRLAVLLARRDHDVFCLNDHDSSRLSTTAQAELVAAFLAAYFPLPSRFERRDAAQPTSNDPGTGR